MKKTISWGNLPINENIKQINFNSKVFLDKNSKLLTYGMGRSYGDVCQNNYLINLDTLDKFLKIDKETGTLFCSANITIKESGAAHAVATPIST